MKTTPFWWEEAPRREPTVPSLPGHIDVAVIGSGYTGLSTALVLARAGVRVAVFEKDRLGEGASSRNGGMVGPSFHKLGLTGLKAKYGEEKTHEIVRESVGFVDFLEGFIKTENIDAEFARTGRFRGAWKPAHYDAMARELEDLQKACGVKGIMVPRREQACETGSEKFYGGVVNYADGGLHPGKFHNELVERVKKAGAILLPQTPVQDVQKFGEGFRLSTPLGVVEADRVAICTNGYTGSQFPHFQRRVLPLRSAIISTEVIAPDLMAKLMPNGRMCGDSRRIVAYYRPSPDGKRILFGSRATGLMDQPEKNARALRSSLVEIYPELEQTAITHVWSGLVAYTFDHAPHIGQFNGIDYAMGFCGSGVSRTIYFGQKLAHKILGNVEEGYTSFDDLPFQSKLLYTGNPWFMPFVLNWHRAADKLGL